MDISCYSSFIFVIKIVELPGISKNAEKAVIVFGKLYIRVYIAMIQNAETCTLYLFLNWAIDIVFPKQDIVMYSYINK